MRYSSLWTIVFLSALAGCSGSGATSNAAPPLAAQNDRAENIMPMSFPVKITQIIPFGVLPGYAQTGVWGLNQHDIAVGVDSHNASPVGTAVMITPSSISNLGGLPTYDDSIAYGINIRNVVVGKSCFEKNGAVDGLCIALRWSFGTINNLGVLPGKTDSTAYAINDSDAIVGYSESNHYVNSDEAVEWTSGTTKALGQGVATSINNHGVIVGYRDDGAFHAVQYSPGTPKPIGPTSIYSKAEAVNNFNVVAGIFFLTSTFNGGKQSRAFTVLNGTVHDIPIPVGGHFVTNATINDLGDVVGTYSKTGFDSGAFISIGGKTVDLNALLPPLSSWNIAGATAIDNNRVVVGYGTFFGNQSSFFLRLK